MAIIFTSIAFSFTVPSASAERANAAVTTNQNDNGLERAAERFGNGVQRAANNVETGVERAADRTERGMERTFGVRDFDSYNTNANRTDANRTRTMNQANYRTNAATTAAAADDGFDWGWLGLIGLLGLAGMRGRDRERDRA